MHVESDLRSAISESSSSNSSTSDEDAFLLFLHPSGPAIANLLMHLFFLLAMVYIDLVLKIAPDDSPSSYPRVLIALFFATLGLSLLMSMCAVLPQLFGRGENIAVIARLKVADMAICICAFGVLCAEFGATASFVRSNCVDEDFMYRDERKYYSDANCVDRYHASVSLLLAVAVLKRVRFDIVAPTSAVMGILFAVFLGFFPESDRTEVTVGHILTGVALLALLTYFRYVLEQSEREHFDITLQLVESAAILTERRGALEARMNEMLPPTIVERSSHRSSLLMKNDTSSEAVLWVMGVADFTVEASKMMQVDMATKLSQLQVDVTEYLQRSTSLQRVSVMLDELTAVGNLLSKSKVAPCVVNACTAGLHVVEGLDPESLPLRVAVHVGEATGCFVGTRWIRYEVTGEAVTTARSALSFATAGGVLVTDAALDAAREFLDVDEGSEMQLLNEKDMPMASAASETSTSSAATTSGWSQLHHLRSCQPHVEVENFSIDATDESSKSSVLHLISSTTTETFQIDNALRFFASTATDGAQQEPTSSTVEKSPSSGNHNSYEMTRRWCVFRVFIDPTVESQYTAIRQHTLVLRAAILWRAYAAFMVLSLVILSSDLREPHGVFAVLMVTAAAAMATVVAIVPFKWPDSIDTWHTPWFVLTLAAQLTFIYGLGLSRPAAIGNDTRHLLIVGALLRGPAFKYARHQLIVTPLMFIAGVLQMMLPGGILQSSTIMIFVVVLFTMFADAEVDLAQRHRFVTSRRIEETVIMLDEEAKVREGLLRMTLPVPVKAWLDNLERCGEELGVARWKTVPDTVVVAATYIPQEQSLKRLRSSSRPSDRNKPRVNAWAVLEEAAAASLWLDIVSISGDTCLLMSPVTMVRLPARSQKKDQERSSDLFEFLASVSEDPRFRLIAEIDETWQVILTQSLPVFLPMGVGVTRTLAINAAADAALRGAIVTERVSQRFSSSGTLQGSGYREHALPSWSIRGVGITRLIRLVKGH